MFKKNVLSLLTLGIYPIVAKSRKGKLTKVTKKYRDDGTVRKDVTLNYEYDDGPSPEPPFIN
jgi:hypothetical protein